MDYCDFLPLNVRDLLSRYCPVGIRKHFTLIGFGDFTQYYYYDCTVNRMRNGAQVMLTKNRLHYDGYSLINDYIDMFCLSYDKSRCIAIGKHDWFVFDEYTKLEMRTSFDYVITSLVCQQNGNVIAASCNRDEIYVFDKILHFLHSIQIVNPLCMAVSSLDQLVVLQGNVLSLFEPVTYKKVSDFWFPQTYCKQNVQMYVGETGQIFVHDFRHNKNLLFQ